MTLAASLLLAAVCQGGPNDWVVDERKISAHTGALGPLPGNSTFGAALTAFPDLDGDGVDELVVGSPWERWMPHASPTPPLPRYVGALRILFLDEDGVVRGVRRILGAPDSYVFGNSLADVGDVDGDGVHELAVGAPFDRSGGVWQGAVWLLALRPDGSVRARQRINEFEGGFTGELGEWGRFGTAVAPLGDLNGDGTVDLAVSEPYDADYYDFECTEPGALWILFLRPDGTVKAQRKIELGSFAADEPCRYLGASLASLDDLDGDGIRELAVGMPGRGSFDQLTPGFWVFFLRSDGTLRAHTRTDITSGVLAGLVSSSDGFAWSMAPAPDLDLDGFDDLAVGALYDGDGANQRGAVWLLSIAPDGTVYRQRKISATSGGLVGPLEAFGAFGLGLAKLGADPASRPRIAVGAPGTLYDTTPTAAWILTLQP